MDAALEADILLFNVESEAELHLLAARAEALGKVARFALRVNPDVFAETHPYISTGLSEHKFGIDIKAARAIYRAAKNQSGSTPPASPSTSAHRSARSIPSPPRSPASPASSPTCAKMATTSATSTQAAV
ncbi:hypothetical protein [Tunturiibacter gelidiferens]|uniref:hypothetical protein n=1 Tax=Tunturiibacter gelidiferens TaxID=3069689 RepID=UPI003D9ABD2F